ncbi:MAG: N-6 DNA methylase [Chitinophagales bacterium]
MLDTLTKKRIDDCRDILVGKLPDPKAQIEQITIGLIYKFMDDMDKEAIELGGKAKFFSDEYAKYSWDSLFDTKVTATEMLNLYSEAIISMDKNPNIPELFRNIFKNAFLPYRDPETLKLFLKTIGEFEYTHSEKLGDAFEYLLSVMGSQGDAGQFRTPRHIIDFLVACVDPSKTDTILDPACGTAGFLISAFKHIKNKAEQGINKISSKGVSLTSEKGVSLKSEKSASLKSEKGVSLKSEKGVTLSGVEGLTPDERKKLIQNFVGYDISPDMVRLSLVNLYLHGFSDPHIWEYDTLSSEDRWNESFDVVLANPPFMSPKGGIRPHKKFTISSNRSEVLFVDYIAEHLNPKGRAGIIVPEGVIFQSGKAYKELRKMLVDNYLYAVVSLPAGVFNPYSGVKTSILLMDKDFAKKTDDILFVKIDNDGYGLGAQRNEIKGGQLEDAIELLHQFKQRNTEFISASALAHAVPKTEIAKNGDYNLSGERYKNIQDLSSIKYEIVEIGEVFNTSSGGTPLKSKEEYYTNGTIPWLRSGEVVQGYITSSNY